MTATPDSFAEAAYSQAILDDTPDLGVGRSFRQGRPELPARYDRLADRLAEEEK